MKKVLIFAISILLCVSCVACFSPTDSAEDTAGGVENTSNPLGDYEVDVLSARFSMSYDDKEIVVIKYKFINNKESAAAFDSSIDLTVYQEGIECKRYYSYDGDFVDNGDKKIKTGKSIEVEYAYYLNNKSDIEVECKEIFSFTDESEKKIFRIIMNK